MNEPLEILDKLMVLTKKWEAGTLSPAEYFEQAAPFIADLTRAMAIANEKSRATNEELEKITLENKEKIEELMLDDIVLRASHAFIQESNLQEEFTAYFERALNDVSADIRRKEFKIVK